MNAGGGNPELLRQEAQSVAIRSQEPFVAWSELRRWSFDKGPAGMKAAAEAFLAAHGGRPEAAAVIPEISRIALTLPEPERRKMLELANSSFSTLSGARMAPGRLVPFSRFFSSLLPKKEVPLPQSAKPLRISPDIALMMENRDMLFQVNRGGPELLSRDRRGYPAFSPARRGILVADASSGHELIQSLSERLSMHGHEPGNPYGVQLAAEKRPAVKKSTRRTPARKKAAKSALGKKSRSRRKPVRKISRR